MRTSKRRLRMKVPRPSQAQVMKVVPWHQMCPVIMTWWRRGQKKKVKVKAKDGTVMTRGRPCPQRKRSPVLQSWALPSIFCYFLPFYFAFLVTCSPLVPSHAAQTATKSPDKSPDGSPDHSAVRYHMPSLCSPQHSTASPFNPFMDCQLIATSWWTASSWWNHT